MIPANPVREDDSRAVEEGRRGGWLFLQGFTVKGKIKSPQFAQSI